MGPEDFDDDNEYEDGDEAGVDCGLMMMTDGKEICMSAGTEWCDWDCPYRDEAPQFRKRERKIPSAPLLEIMERK